MRRLVRNALAGFAAGTALAALLAAAVPLWLLLRVPGAVTSPEPEPR